MTDRIVVVTPPDDVFQLGFRLLTVNLTVDQLDQVSSSIKDLKIDCDIIVYLWKTQSDIQWLLDKIYKCDGIIFNADDIDQTLVGFLAGQKRSAYFGNLRTIKEINKSVIFDSTQCTEFLNRYIGLYEQISR